MCYIYIDYHLEYGLYIISFWNLSIITRGDVLLN